ncbi:MAG: FISUMP domain-containing protein [Bacteroidota bacterium]
MDKVKILLFLFLLVSIKFQAQKIEAIQIDSQVWMMKNIAIDPVANEKIIFHARNEEQWKYAAEKGIPAWCYPGYDEALGNTYGSIFNGFAVRDEKSMCPQGWLIPTDEDWDQLVRYVGGEYVAGTKLKSVSHWIKNGNGTDDFKFSIFPAGTCGTDGKFYLIGGSAGFWTSSETGNFNNWARTFYHFNNDAMRSNPSKKTGFFVRCIKNRKVNNMIDVKIVSKK